MCFSTPVATYVHLGSGQLGQKSQMKRNNQTSVHELCVTLQTRGDKWCQLPNIPFSHRGTALDNSQADQHRWEEVSHCQGRRAPQQGPHNETSEQRHWDQGCRYKYKHGGPGTVPESLNATPSRKLAGCAPNWFVFNNCE